MAAAANFRRRSEPSTPCRISTREIRIATMLSARLSLALLLARAAAFAPTPGCAPAAAYSALSPPRPLAHQRIASLRMEEYSTKVKITTETRAPLRQARIFFLYPSTIAGASIAAYVSLVRALAGNPCAVIGKNTRPFLRNCSFYFNLERYGKGWGEDLEASGAAAFSF